MHMWQDYGDKWVCVKCNASECHHKWIQVGPDIRCERCDKFWKTVGAEPVTTPQPAG